MGIKHVKAAVQGLTDKLSDEQFLSASGMTARGIRMLMNREYWETHMAGLFPVRRRFTCAEIYDICAEPLDLLGREPEGGWMSYTYKYVCHILYPEEEFSAGSAPYATGCLFYLTVLQFFFEEERKALPWDEYYDFEFLSPEEAANFESSEEYERFLHYFRKEYVYEMMRLGLEVTPFRALEHISGVHYVALHVARGLYAAGVPIDLTLVSGAAAGHDIGKFGCKPNEKVPYLHYYYTDQWFGRHNMDYIGHIAANHSTWDLEPENLTVESLVLIYSDFRVKQSRGQDNKEITFISSLKDAFDVILNKLDNVDEKKLLRYKFVYERLRDFEEYMKSMGADTDLNGKTERPAPMPELTLRNAEESVRTLVHMGVEHNINVMHLMSAERQFGNFLESARSEKDWKNLRAYLSIFFNFSAYANDSQKKQILYFLYELLMHREGQIRAEAAQLMGKILAQFNFGYRKQRPADMPDLNTREADAVAEEVLELLLHPDLKLVTRQKRRIRFNTKNVLASVLKYCTEGDRRDYLTIFMKCFTAPESREENEAFVIMDAVHELPLAELTDEELNQIAAFTLYYAAHPSEEVRIASWRSAKVLTDYKPELEGCRAFRDVILHTDTTDNVTMTYLKLRILRNLGENVEEEEHILYDQDVVSDIFLENLKTATPWIVKAVNIKLLKDQLHHGEMAHKLHIAAHLSNLIKVSEYVMVREDAGEALLDILHYLRADECNEVVMELREGIEVGDFDFSNYIPKYLGQCALWLPPAELDEVISHLIGLEASPNVKVAASALDTLGVMLCHYPGYRGRYEISDDEYEEKKKILLGAIFRGLANYREPVRQEALRVVDDVFYKDTLSLDEKYSLFVLGWSKILFQFHEEDPSMTSMFYRASALTAINQFITEWHMYRGEIQIPMRDKVAFFPGTFDPFSLSHKEIVREIRDLGFEVYLAVDEFSWSKKTQPRLVRRRIVNMSVADEFHVNLYPDTIPVNIANPEDLKVLRESFGGRELYMVAGTDVIANASSYKVKAVPNSIHHLNHVVFRRKLSPDTDPGFNRDIFKNIRGKVIEVELPEQFEDISSTMIRENIDMNRDISNLIDPVAQEYIYNNGLYLREPEYKPLAAGKVLYFEEWEAPEEAVLEEAAGAVLAGEENPEAVLDGIRKAGDKLLVLRNLMKDNRMVGFVCFRYLGPNELFSVLRDVELAQQVRHRTSGEILMITGLYIRKDALITDPSQYLLSEVIARSFPHSCSYAIYFQEHGTLAPAVESVLERQGFVRAEEFHSQIPLYLVDMHSPLVLLKNMETTIKEPLASEPSILRVMEKAHMRLQKAMTMLYPGELVLSLSAVSIYPRLVEKVTETNGVPNEVVTPRKLGECMCVPYGKILRDKVIPNTVTKTLHTDKVYPADLGKGHIEAFPNYASLPEQIRMLRSFKRPVILVDDMLHFGGRFEALEPMFKKEKIDIRKVILAVISGYGRDTMAVKGIDVDSVYFIPNIRKWFVESTLYPFIGGDTVSRPTQKVAGLSPSINMIFPYTKPAEEIMHASPEALYEFSACCIRNSRDIFLTLEEAYRTRFGRNLTLERLSEAVIAPLCPDRGECVNYDPNLSASTYLENDLEMLNRII